MVALGFSCLSASLVGEQVSVPYIRVIRGSLESQGTVVSIISTAVPFSWPERNRSSAVLACSKGNVSVSVLTGTRGAISKNSSPSRRVRFATEVIARTPQRSAYGNDGISL